MKTLLSLPLAAALLLVGCGKSADQKKMEADLNAEVMKIHQDQMKQMTEIRDLMGGIDMELATFDKLTREHPREMKGQTPDDLVNAKKMLLSAKGAMESWMSGYTMYHEGMKHEEAMAKLAKDKEELASVQGKINAALSAANTTLDAHRKSAEQIAAAAPRRVKK
jgi:hypothetical protein